MSKSFWVYFSPSPRSSPLMSFLCLDFLSLVIISPDQQSQSLLIILRFYSSLSQREHCSGYWLENQLRELLLLASFLIIIVKNLTVTFSPCMCACVHACVCPQLIYIYIFSAQGGSTLQGLIVSNLTPVFSHILFPSFLQSGCRSAVCSGIVVSYCKPSLWVYVSSHCFCWVVFWVDVISFHPLSGGCPRYLGCSRDATLTCHVIAKASVYFHGCSSCNPLWDPQIFKLTGKLKTIQPY